MTTAHALGTWGEERAAEFLERLGYRIVERNWRCAHGEIDLVARDRETTVFVEVKTRRGRDFGHPFAAITPTKLGRLHRLAMAWCEAHPGGHGTVRVDGVAVTLRGSRVEVEHLRGLR